MAGPALALTGTVVALTVQWPEHGIPRTVVTFATDVRGALPGDEDGRVDVVVPGANGDPRAVVTTLPVFRPGQRWRVRLVETAAGLTVLGLDAGLESLDPLPPLAFNLSGVHYPESLLPRTFVLAEAGSEDLGPGTTEQAVEEALGAWNAVGCSTFRFEYGGLVQDPGVANDGVNVLRWQESNWEWDPAVAGITLTSFGEVEGGFGAVEADVVLNGQSWVWTLDPGDSYAAPPTVHAGSVLVHELGHVTGLGHVDDDATATMFYAYVGGDWQATPAGDDRRGLCENYPTGGDECEGDGDCQGIDGSERTCVELEGVRVCEEVRDPQGAECSRTSINCEEYCVFTGITAQSGYCTVGCPDGVCPDGYSCGEEDGKLPLDEEPVCLEAEDPGDDDTTPAADDDSSAGADDDAGPDPEPGACGCGGDGGDDGGGGGAAPVTGALLAAPQILRRRNG